MKNQVLSLLCGVSFLVSSSVFAMEPEKTEPKGIVARPTFTVEKPNPNTKPLEWMFHEGLFDSTRINFLSPRHCFQLLVTSKALHNWFEQRICQFSLGVHLKDSFFKDGSSLIKHTSNNPDLSFLGRKLSLWYSTEETCLSTKETSLWYSTEETTTQNKPLIPLISFETPLSFDPHGVIHCLNNNKLLSYFPTLYGKPKQFFLQGIPEGWFGGMCFPNGVPLPIKEYNLSETSFDVSLEGVSIDNSGDAPYDIDITTRLRPFIELASDSDSDLTVEELIDRLKMIKMIKMFEDESSEEEDGHTLNIFENFPDEDLIDEMYDSEQLLMVGDAFNEDDTNLFSQIIQLKNEAWDNEEIALYLRISEDEVDEILNSQPANQ